MKFINIKKFKLSKFIKNISYICGICFIMSSQAIADTVGGSGMPWEGPLQKIVDSITGPVARVIAVLAIVLAGLGIAFGEAGSGVRKLFQVVFGLAIAFGAASIVASVFSPSSGVIF